MKFLLFAVLLVQVLTVRIIKKKIDQKAFLRVVICLQFCAANPLGTLGDRLGILSGLGI